ncbi:hypothetical protein A2U01_0065902, partial [Trifolium medium]|nr:hypothetical protein [Trifolium medium]
MRQTIRHPFSDFQSFSAASGGRSGDWRAVDDSGDKREVLLLRSGRVSCRVK